MATWRWERLVGPLRAQLAQGATPEKLALSVAIGVAIGVSPLVGTTTLLCLGLGIVLRLNHPALQLANQAMYLVQVPLLVVFVRTGEWLVGARPAPLSVSGLWLQLRESPAVVMAQLGRSGLHGLIGWAVLAPGVATAVYVAFLPLFRRRTLSSRVAPSTLAACLAVLAAGCGPGSMGSLQLPPEAREIASPAGARSGQPQLGVTPDGRVLLSWVEAVEGGHALRFATRPPRGVWTDPVTVATGKSWFVNWADIPAVTALPDGTVFAHWLARNGTGTYAYEVQVSASRAAGASWSTPVLPHRDGTQSEHGFVSVVPWGPAEAGLVWLDGRRMAAAAAGGHHGGQTMLMHASVRADGTLGPEVVLDDRVCDCCQTAGVRTGDGAVVIAYRDRTADEIRDISVVRWQGGRWSEPRPVSNDGWKIMGCPVNGPALAAAGSRVALAWFSAPGDQPRVQVALSDDSGATFGPPIRVDEGRPLGRVDTLMLPDGATLVSWLERSEGEGARVLVRKIGARGTRGSTVTVATSSAARASGFPRMEAAGNEVVVAWTDASDPPRVRAAALNLE